MENIQTDLLTEFENKLGHFFIKNFTFNKNKDLFNKIFLPNTRYHLKKTIKLIPSIIFFLMGFKKNEIIRYLDKNLKSALKIYKSLITLLFIRRKTDNLIMLTQIPRIKSTFLDILFQKFFLRHSESYIFFIENNVFSIIHIIYQQKVTLFFEIVIYLNFFLICCYQNECNPQISNEHLALYNKNYLKSQKEKIEKCNENEMILTKNIKAKKSTILLWNLKKIYGFFKLKQLIFLKFLKKSFDKILNFSVLSVFIANYLTKKEQLVNYYFLIY